MSKLLTSQHKIRTRFHTRPALATHPPKPGPADDSRENDSEDEDDGDGDVQKRRDFYLNLMIYNLVRQNALIRTDHISQSHMIRQLQCRNNV